MIDPTTDPTTDPLEAFSARVRRMRWLKPDASTESLTVEAREQMTDRVSEHLATVCALRKQEPPTARPEVSFTRSMTEANTRWEAAWSEPPPPEALWHVLMLNDLREEQELDAPIEVTSRARHAVLDALRVSRPPVPVAPPELGYMLEQLDHVPALATLTAHAEYLAAHPGAADGSRSPWSALVELWDLGVWPMILPNGAFLIYVPVQDAQGVVPDVDRPSVREMPRRTPAGARWSHAIPPLHRLGVGPGPCIFPLPPVLRPSMPSLPNGPGIRPPDLQPMLLGGAPMPVAPQPPPWKPFPVAEVPPAAEEPWYKRLARKFGR